MAEMPKRSETTAAAVPKAETTKTAKSTETAKTAEAVATIETVFAEPKLEDDLAHLESIDTLKVCLIRLKQGRHPSPAVESLLKRRLNLEPRRFMGPYPVRLVCTFLMVLAGCGFAWVVLWALGSLVNLTNFLRELSALMGILLVGLLAFSISNPIKLFDEKEIEATCRRQINELKIKLSNEKGTASVENKK